MKQIAIITNENFNEISKNDPTLTLRKAARAVLLNDLGEVAIIYIKNGDYHKIPGGGIEDSEDIKEALKREIIEETGASKIEIMSEIGEITELRDNLKQISFCYMAKVIGPVNTPNFTEEEMTDGFSDPIWLPIDKAIELFKNDKATFLNAKFMSLRDKMFLEEASKSLTLQ